MTQMTRVAVATAMLIGLFAMTRGQPAAALAAAEGDKGGGDDPSAAACLWGYVECPDPSGFLVTYTTGSGCGGACAEAQYKSLSAALAHCNDLCSAACVTAPFTETCP